MKWKMLLYTTKNLENLVEGSVVPTLLVKQSITTSIIKFFRPSVIVKPIVKSPRVALSLEYKTYV
jgi:hypothetical protein